jgi:hypothetical protein
MLAGRPFGWRAVLIIALPQKDAHNCLKQIESIVARLEPGKHIAERIVDDPS